MCAYYTVSASAAGGVASSVVIAVGGIAATNRGPFMYLSVSVTPADRGDQGF